MNIKLKSDVKKLWLKALRATNKRAYRELRSMEAPHTYCAYGLLVKEWAKKHKKNFRLGADSACVLPNQRVMKWAFRSKNIIVPAEVVLRTGNHNRTVYNMSDSDVPFNTIANLIEQQL